MLSVIDSVYNQLSFIKLVSYSHREAKTTTITLNKITVETKKPVLYRSILKKN